jgi:diadenylate cyclase
MLFKIGFLAVNWTDIVDVLVVGYLFYKLYTVMRGTIAVQIFVGLLLIIAGSFIARAINLQAMTWILMTLTDIWVIAFIILFQPELRRLLVILGRGKLLSRVLSVSMEDTIESIVGACEEMAQKQIGALIVFERSTRIRMTTETGTRLGAEVSKHLLLSIFNPKSPLHDGAVVIKDRVIEAARCTLPLTTLTQINGFSMGMRHRSAVGMTEQSDALAIVVSEETGTISVAMDGNLHSRLSRDELSSILREELSAKNIFEPMLSFNQDNKQKAHDA